VLAAVKSGRLTEKRIEESARRILTAKYDLTLVKQRFTDLNEIDRIVASRETNALAQEIAEHAITLVRNEEKLVPLSRYKPGASLFNLAITNGDDRLWITNAFMTAMVQSGRIIETRVLDDRSSNIEIEEALNKAKAADIIIASLYGRVRSGQARSVGLPEAGTRALSTLIANKARVIGISFGNPYLLQSFPELRTYLVAYGDMPSLQQAAARALMGEIDIRGKLPITLPGLYARGAGIEIKRDQR
jgi:beta-N-acetylhexosaminidase